MGSILWGILMIIAGASGQFVLRGTDSSAALQVVGVIFVIIGIVQMTTGSFQKKKKETELFNIIDNKIMKGPILPKPCKVVISRPSKTIGASINYELSFNGKPIGALKNGQTLEVETSYQNNIIVCPSFPNYFEFEAISNGHISLGYKKADGKAKQNLEILGIQQQPEQIISNA